MDAPERGALMLVRFIAAALIAWAVVDVALYLAVCQHANKPVQISTCMIKSISAVLGLVVLVKARAIAEWVSNKLDE
ncbi:MAG: hypothetical protein WDM80_13570 [Limisphaerales bacterium]